jgi:peptidoglycan/LPS O-acetylase OafA/YrhL
VAATVGVDARRSAGIDVLRGLSIVFVVLHHVHLRFHLNGFEVLAWLPKSVQWVLWWSGYYSVIAFFVISGFLITRLSIARWGQLGRISLRDFYALRFARLAPCLFTMLAVSSALHLSGFADFRIEAERASLGRALVAALGFHVNWLEAERGYLPGNWDVLWSLSVEEAFYVLFPLVCITLRSERWLLLPLLALVVLGPWNRTRLMGQSPWDDFAYLSCSDGIAFGCLSALAAARLDLGPRLRRFALGFGITAALLIVVFRRQGAALGLMHFGLNVSVLELGVASMLLAFGTGGGTSSLASRFTAPLRLLGRASYEIYLGHMFVVLAAATAFKRLSVDPAHAPIWYVGISALCAALGLLVSRFISEPANRALRARWRP